jgi:FMN-dependent NADH-azoreductase
MNILLEIDSSPLDATASISRYLTAAYVEQWKIAHPNGQVIRRDLASSHLPAITAEWIGASFTPPEALTPGQRESLTLSETLIAELEAADEYVIGVPMHNFTVAANLRLWIDQIVRAGKTFAYVDGTPAGLLKHKKAQFLIASGGVYGPGTAMASYNFVEPYLRTVFGFIGVTDTSFLAAGGASAVNHGKIDRQTFLNPHLQTIRSQFQPV